jgi:hypothetical protein
MNDKEFCEWYEGQCEKESRYEVEWYRGEYDDDMYYSDEYYYDAYHLCRYPHLKTPTGKLT